MDKRGHLLRRNVEYTLTGAREGGNDELLSLSCRVPVPDHEKVLKGIAVMAVLWVQAILCNQND